MSNTWIDELRAWNYDLGPVGTWLWDSLQYNVVRHGYIAYLVAALTVIMIFLSFPPTRGLTKTLCSSLFKAVLTYAQLVASFLTIHLVVALAKISLTLFHKCRVWVGEAIERARQKD
jgi:hypothetical protein